MLFSNPPALTSQTAQENSNEATKNFTQELVDIIFVVGDYAANENFRQDINLKLYSVKEIIFLFEHLGEIRLTWIHDVLSEIIPYQFMSLIIVRRLRIYHRLTGFLSANGVI